MFTVIQGTVDADVKGELSQTEISKSIDFCFSAFAHVPVDQKEAVTEKMRSLGLDGATPDDAKTKEALEELEKTLSPEELRIMHTIRARQMVRAEDSLNIDNFSVDVINGMRPHLQRGSLGLTTAKPAPIALKRVDALSLLSGEAKGHVHVNEEKVPKMEMSSEKVAVTA